MKKITGSELFCYIHNCLKPALDENGNVRFYRFTPRQFQVYNKNSISAIRAVLPTGVKLEFYTDSDRLEIAWDLVQNGPWQVDSLADLYVDGVLVKAWQFSGEPEPTVRLSAELPAGNKRVTFWLNRTFEIALKELAISENAVISPVPAGKCHLALGDSITFSSAKHPSLGYVSQVAEHFGWEMYNQAIGGYIFDADSLDPDLPVTPDVITVAYGTNDDRSDREAYRRRVNEFLKGLTEIWPEVPAFVITPLWRTDVSGTEQFEWIYPVIEEECARFPQITVIDGHTLMPQLPDFYSDGFLHPNDLGMTFYAQSVVKAIEASGRVDC